MVQPTDFVSPLLQASINPAASFAQGMAVGNGLVDNQRAAVKDQREGLLFQQAQQGRTAAIEAARAQAIEAAKKAVADADDLAALKADGSTQAYLDYAKAHPEQTEAMVKLHTAQTKEVQARRLEQSVRTKALLSHGEKNTAVDLLRRDALALEESDPREAEALRRQAQSIDDDETGSMVQADLWLSAVAPKELAEVNEKLSVQPGVVRKANADAKKAAAEAEIKELDAVNAEVDKLLEQGFKREQTNALASKAKNDAGTLQLGWAKHFADLAAARAALAAKSVEMTPGMQSKAEAAADDAVMSRAVGAKAGRLAARFDAHAKSGVLEGSPSGVLGKLDEGINSLRGKTGDMTADRAELKGIVEKVVGSELKGGGAITDGERESIRRTMPTEFSDPVAVAEWLRRVERFQARAAKVDQGKAEFIAQNGSLKTTTAPMVVSGFEVPAGMTYPEFTEKYDAHIGPADAKPAFAERAQQLKAEGMSPDAAKAKMKSEGY